MRLVIVEDETLVARRIERLARDILGEQLTQVDVASDLTTASAALERGDTAVLLLDLNLSGRDGFELLRRAVAEPCQTIVISANIDRALEAFELGVVDFVPKPFQRERLEKALQRALAPRRDPERAPRYLATTLAGRVDLIAIDTVVAIHGADDYSEIETLDGRKHLHKKTLTALLDLLPERFQRVHRSHLVNLDFARALQTDDQGRRHVELTNGTRVPVGRSNYKALSQLLGD